MKKTIHKLEDMIEDIARIKKLMPTEKERDFIERYNPLTLYGIIKKMEGLTNLEARRIGKTYQEKFYKPFMIFYRLKKNGE